MRSREVLLMYVIRDIYTIIYLYYCAQIARESRRMGGGTGTRSLGRGQHSTFGMPARFGTLRQTSRDSAAQKRDNERRERKRPIGCANRNCTRVRRCLFSFLLFCAVDRQTTTIMRIECMPILVVYAPTPVTIS